VAISRGIFGSIDANRGDYQNGWDTDQFPNSVDELSLVLFEILRAGGFDRGGFNFDTKLRRQSLARDDLFHGHIGGIDTLAQALLVADALLQDATLEENRQQRYAAWDGPLGDRIRSSETDLASLADLATDGGIDPVPVSGRQEWLENEVNRVIWTTE